MREIAAAVAGIFFYSTVMSSYALAQLANRRVARARAPARAAANGGAIQILSGTYGGNCPGVAKGNKTTQLAAACNGKTSCQYSVRFQVLGDPKPGCAKSYVARWRCRGGPIRTVSAPPEAGFGSKLTLTCGVAAHSSPAIPFAGARPGAGARPRPVGPARPTPVAARRAQPAPVLIRTWARPASVRPVERPLVGPAMFIGQYTTGGQYAFIIRPSVEPGTLSGEARYRETQYSGHKILQLDVEPSPETATISLAHAHPNDTHVRVSYKLRREGNNLVGSQVVGDKPGVKITLTPSTIEKIAVAIYGGNLGVKKGKRHGKQQGQPIGVDASGAVGKACVGKTHCEYLVDAGVLGDPAFGKGKNERS